MNCLANFRLLTSFTSTRGNRPYGNGFAANTLNPGLYSSRSASAAVPRSQEPVERVHASSATLSTGMLELIWGVDGNGGGMLVLTIQ